MEPLWPLQPVRLGPMTPPVGPDGVELHLPNGLAKGHRSVGTQVWMNTTSVSQGAWAHCLPGLIKLTESAWWLTNGR